MSNLFIVATILLAFAGLAYVVYFFVRVARGERLEESDSAPEYLTEAERETKACPYCGEEILDVAVKCKHCGSKLDPEDDGEPTNTIGQLAGSVVGLALLIYLASLFFPDIPSALKVPLKSPDIQISSTELLRHYQENEVEADLKYKGKVALVTGIVGDLGKTFQTTFTSPYAPEVCSFLFNASLGTLMRKRCHE